MRAFRLVLLGGLTAMVLGGLRAIVHGGDPAEMAGVWALVACLGTAGLQFVHALLGRGLQGSRQLAAALLVGLFVLLLGTAAGYLAGRDPEIAAAVLAVLAMFAAPLLWAWTDRTAALLERFEVPRQRWMTWLARRRRDATIVTGAAAVSLAAIISRAFTVIAWW